MRELERLRGWLSEAPGAERIREMRFDYTDQAGENGGIFPLGVREVSRKENLWGRVRVQCQLRFVLYLILLKAPGVDAAENAAFVLQLQRWMMQQSVAHRAPTFGDEPESERLTAQNGALFDASDEGTATYKVELCVSYTKIYEE